MTAPYSTWTWRVGSTEPIEFQLTADGEAVDLSGVTSVEIRLRAGDLAPSVDYDTVTNPPKWRAGFELWPGNILYIADDPEPAASDVARVWFARAQTVEGLDAAASTTLPGEHSQMLVTGSSGYAASARASALRETVSAEDDSYKQTAGFAFRRLNEFRAGLNRIRARAAGGYVALPVQRRGRVPRQ